MHSLLARSLSAAQSPPRRARVDRYRRQWGYTGSSSAFDHEMRLPRSRDVDISPQTVFGASSFLHVCLRCPNGSLQRTPRSLGRGTSIRRVTVCLAPPRSIRRSALVVVGFAPRDRRRCAQDCRHRRSNAFLQHWRHCVARYQEVGRRQIAPSSTGLDAPLSTSGGVLVTRVGRTGRRHTPSSSQDVDTWRRRIGRLSPAGWSSSWIVDLGVG